MFYYRRGNSATVLSATLHGEGRVPDFLVVEWNPLRSDQNYKSSNSDWQNLVMVMRGLPSSCGIDKFLTYLNC